VTAAIYVTGSLKYTKRAGLSMHEKALMDFHEAERFLPSGLTLY
jgi:hypothetical protein